MRVTTKFLSTPSARRATPTEVGGKPGQRKFLSTPSARRATDRPYTKIEVIRISIHALREEGDRRGFYQVLPAGISIHALREEGDEEQREEMAKAVLFLSTPSARRATIFAGTAAGRDLFLSTPSARRATWRWISSRPTTCYFYPRPPRGGRPAGVSCPQPRRKISIHALREEGDLRS